MEELWRGILLGTDERYRKGYRFMSRLPGSPRCQFCSAPFAGMGAPVARLMGRRPFRKNPRYCDACFILMENQHGGAEVECTLLFADVRGSTAIAERMSPGEFSRLMNRFYDTASKVLFAHSAILDKFVGDEAVAIFIPALNGEQHAARAMAAGRALLSETGHDGPEPWAPLGVGIHTGPAFVGAVGDPPNTDLTALGDAVNVASRLATAAGPGELLITKAAATAAGLTGEGLERRELDLKGRAERVSVLVVASR